MRNLHKTSLLPNLQKILENKIQLADLIHSSLKLPFYFHHYPLVLVTVEIQTKLLLAGDEGLVTDHLFNPAHLCQQHPVLVYHPVHNWAGCIQLVWSSGPQVSRPACYAWLQALNKRGT